MRKENPEQARRALDRRFEGLGSPEPWTVPRAGWIRAIRDALGMSAASLADRMGVKEPAVFALEKTEQQGTARLDTLRRAAEALDCTFVYAMIPNQDLESQVRRQAERVVDAQLQRARHTMALEDQEAELSEDARADLIDRVASTRGLWSRQ